MNSTGKDIVILGSRIAANMAAAYLKMQHPGLTVTIVGRSDRNPPLVGESLTEYSTIFLRSIGMGDILEKKHFPKYGLSFYFKEELDNPADRRYAVHEATEEHAIPSFLINRVTFDDDLEKLNRSNGVEFIDAKVQDVEIGNDKPHRIKVKKAAGEVSTLSARWIIDATGRNRLLAKKLGLPAQQPKHQRDAFWFRLANFDPAILKNVEAIRSSQPPFDSYYVAHHFLGKGHWVWCIPLNSPDHEHLISIGVTSRPDLSGKVSDMESFLAQVESEHPMLADLVRSGEVIDTNCYANYMYETQQLYSTDRWFLVGDCADTSDPLYSTGLVMTAIQTTQVSELISRDLSDGYTAEFARDLEMAYKTIRDPTQHEIEDLYEVIHDPYQSHWRVHITSALYFYFMLPQVMSGYLTDPVGARWITKIGTMDRKKIRMLNELLVCASPRMGHQVAEKIHNMYDRSVNWELGHPRDEDIPRYLCQLLMMLIEIRWSLLRDAGWRGWHRQVAPFVGDLGKALIMRTFFYGRSLKKSPVIRRFVGL